MSEPLPSAALDKLAVLGFLGLDVARFLVVEVPLLPQLVQHLVVLAVDCFEVCVIEEVPLISSCRNCRTWLCSSSLLGNSWPEMAWCSVFSSVDDDI